MFVACIACGGMLEITLFSLGLSFVYNWFKNRHKKEDCDCCKNQDKIEVSPIISIEESSSASSFSSESDVAER